MHAGDTMESCRELSARGPELMRLVLQGECGGDGECAERGSGGRGNEAAGSGWELKDVQQNICHPHTPLYHQCKSALSGSPATTTH